MVLYSLQRKYKIKTNITFHQERDKKRDILLFDGQKAGQKGRQSLCKGQKDLISPSFPTEK